MHIPAWGKVGETMNDDNIDVILAPWERLAQSQAWPHLQLCLPYDWLPCLKDREER